MERGPEQRPMDRRDPRMADPRMSDPRAAEGRPRPPMEQRPTLPPRAGDPVSEFAKRPPNRPVAEVPPRPAPQHADEDEQLEIPAFLRRQAN